jgi:hypothetical protein
MKKKAIIIPDLHNRGYKILLEGGGFVFEYYHSSGRAIGYDRMPSHCFEVTFETKEEIYSFAKEHDIDIVAEKAEWQVEYSE